MGKNHITIIILYAFLNNVWLNECVTEWVCGCVCHSVNREKGNYQFTNHFTYFSWQMTIWHVYKTISNILY